VLAAALLASLAALAIQAPLSVDIREAGYPTWLIALKTGIAVGATAIIMIAVMKVLKRCLEKGATEPQLTVAALAWMAALLSCWILSMWFVLGT
jgi:hypothetical protein